MKKMYLKVVSILVIATVILIQYQYRMQHRALVAKKMN